jgi:hypothetical protein
MTDAEATPALDIMVKIQEAMASGDISRSLPMFRIGGGGAGESLRRQAMHECINDFLARANTEEAGLLLYTLPEVLDMRVLVGAGGDVYVSCPSHHAKH